MWARPAPTRHTAGQGVLGTQPSCASNVQLLDQRSPSMLYRAACNNNEDASASLIRSAPKRKASEPPQYQGNGFDLAERICAREEDIESGHMLSDEDMQGLMCCFFHLEDREFLNVVKAVAFRNGQPLVEAGQRAAVVLRPDSKVPVAVRMALPAEEWQALGCTIPFSHPGMQELLKSYPFLQDNAMSKEPRSTYGREMAMRFCHMSDVEKVAQGFLPLPLDPPCEHARAVTQYWSQTREGRPYTRSESLTASPLQSPAPSLQRLSRISALPSQPPTPSPHRITGVPCSPPSAPSSSSKAAKVPPSPQKLLNALRDRSRVHRAVSATAAQERSHSLRRAQAYLDQVLKKAAPTCIVPSASVPDFLDFIVCPKTATLMEAV